MCDIRIVLTETDNYRQNVQRAIFIICYKSEILEVLIDNVK